MTRPAVPEWGLRIAEVVATRSTCLRRAVGCVILDRRGNILATGHNGVPSGSAHCNELVKESIHGPEYEKTWGKDKWMQQDCIGFRDTFPHACPGASFPSGEGLDSCDAIHAEINAGLQCHAVGLLELGPAELL